MAMFTKVAWKIPTAKVKFACNQYKPNIIQHLKHQFKDIHNSGELLPLFIVAVVLDVVFVI